MCSARKNTLVIDFSVLPTRPDVAKVQHFLENELKLNYADVISIQLHHLRNCVLLEMKSYDIASRYQSQHNWKRKMLCAGAEFLVPVYVDCAAVTVRLHNLPPSMSHSTIRDYMLKFGEVITIRNETWKHYFPGIPNGVRVLRMNLLRDIPSFITIGIEDTMVSYENQPKSCRYCGQPTHPGKRCLQSSTQIPNKSSSVPSNSTDGLFNPEDFPPINNDQPTSSLPVASVVIKEKQQNDDEWTDIDDNTSSSSTDYNGATNKRRRSKRNKEDLEVKKMCSDQCSPNTSHSETIVCQKRKVFNYNKNCKT